MKFTLAPKIFQLKAYRGLENLISTSAGVLIYDTANVLTIANSILFKNELVKCAKIFIFTNTH